MLKKTITYTDYNGNERTETFYFNLSKAEILEMDMENYGGLSDMLTAIAESKDIPTAVKIFKRIVLKAYGEKSTDGKRFIKSEELSTAFSQTEAYNKLFMELVTGETSASDFINGIIPNDTNPAVTVNPTTPN
jgi:hypothetical protein